MKPSNREILQKADIAVANLQANGGYLNPEQSDRFLRMVLDQPTILREVRTVPMNKPQRKVEKIGFDSRILRPAPASGSYLDAADRAAPTTDLITLSTKEFIAEVHVPYDVLEDNIERENLEDTIMELMAERVALDLEELLVLGDTGSADPYLATLDGIIASASSHVKDITANALTMSKAVLKAGLKEMPAKYLRDRSKFRFWVSHNNETEYRDTIADRETGLGDNTLEGFRPVYAYGIPVVPSAMVPETKVILTHPQNILWGVQRQIAVETDKDIRARTYIIVLTLRVDMKLETEDALVVVTGVQTSGESGTEA